MKRRLIYGLLVCLFVCAGGMEGYGQYSLTYQAGYSGCPGTVDISVEQICGTRHYWQLVAHEAPNNGSGGGIKLILKNGNDIIRPQAFTDNLSQHANGNNFFAEGSDGYGTYWLNKNSIFYVIYDPSVPSVYFEDDSYVFTNCGASIRSAEVTASSTCLSSNPTLTATYNTLEGNVSPYPQYEWYKDGTIIAALSSSSTYHPSSAGEYKVRIYADDDTYAESDAINIFDNSEPDWSLIASKDHLDKRIGVSSSEIYFTIQQNNDCALVDQSLISVTNSNSNQFCLIKNDDYSYSITLTEDTREGNWFTNVSLRYNNVTLETIPISGRTFLYELTWNNSFGNDESNLAVANMGDLNICGANKYWRLEIVQSGKINVDLFGASNYNIVDNLTSHSNGNKFEKDNGHARSWWVDAPMYIVYNPSTNTLIFQDNAPTDCGPVLTNTAINATAFCGGEATLTADYTISGLYNENDISYKWYENDAAVYSSSTNTYTTNSIGDYRFEILLSGISMGFSDIIKVTAPSPELNIIASTTSIRSRPNQVELSSVVITPSLDNSCEEGEFKMPILSNTDKFSITDNGDGSYTLIFTETIEEGDFETSVLFETIDGTYTASINVVASLFDFPRTYVIKKSCNGGNTWEDYEITTTADGDISIIMNSEETCTYRNEGYIHCRNFSINSTAGDYCYSTFINAGAIDATNDIQIGSSSQPIPGISPFQFECTSSMTAGNKIDLSYRQALPPVRGVFRSVSYNVINAQGGHLKIDPCADIKVNEAVITVSGGTMNFDMQGHLIADTLSIANPTVYVNLTGIMTVGKIKNGTKVIVGKNASANLCINPTPNSSDNLGLFVGTVLYNYGEGGWISPVNPQNEVDINEPDYVKNTIGTYGFTSDDVNNVRLIAAYRSYEDCITEKNMAALLPIELISFNYQKGNNTFVWKTASETNNDYFVVEYSRNGKDWVECSGHVSSVSANGYSYSVNPNMSINNSLFSYFRLKQVDNNGEYSYSNVITVSFSVDNPCSEEYESSKVQIREMGGKWFRVINGELIYCENDN